jgi:WD40 repeat protein
LNGKPLHSYPHSFPLPYNQTLGHPRLSPDGNRLAAITGDDEMADNNEVAVWDAETGKKLYTLVGHQKVYSSLAFSPNGRRLATATALGIRNRNGGTSRTEVKIWDAATGNELLTLKDFVQYSIQYLTFSTDGSRLYAVGLNPGRPLSLEINVWDATPRRDEAAAARP